MDDAGLVVTRPHRRRRRITVSPSRSPSPPRSPVASSPRHRSRQSSPVRRASFGPTDVFLSPVEWSKHPSFDKDAAVVSRILTRGSTMCRDEITPSYIRTALTDPHVAVWLVRDTKERIFGFALTKQHPTHIDLKLICTHRRKGEGIQLFGDILSYSRAQNQSIHLEAVNAKVAALYANAARAAGHRVYLGEAHQQLAQGAFQDAIQRMGRMIPMRIAPSGASAPTQAPDVHSFKAAMRRMHEDSDSDD